MIGSDILGFAYNLTNRDSSTFLDGSEATMYKRLNTLYGQRVLDILRLRVDKNAKINESTTTLVSTVGLSEGDVGYNGEYPFPTDLLRPVRMEVSYDGETWKKCTIYDNTINQNSEFNDEQLKADFSQESPRVDFIRNSYKVRPLKDTTGDITNGIYIEYEKRQSDFTSTTSPSDIEQNLQDVLAYDVAELEMIMHADKYSPTHIQMFMQKKSEIEKRFKNYYKDRLPTRKTLTLKYKNYA